MRTLCLAFLVVGVASACRHGSSAAIHASPDVSSVAAVPFVKGPTEGERLIGPTGEIVIKADPATGATEFAMGTQRLVPNSGIPLHVHDTADEVLFVHAGVATGQIADQRISVQAGSMMFIPRGVWHGVMNPESEVTLVWFVSPPGLESFFRATRAKPGEAPIKLTPKNLREIAAKHQMRFKAN